MGSQYLGLSLFIMLLSFFIVLNSMSDFETTKATPVLSSLNIAFAANPVGENESQSITQAQDSVDTGKGDTLDQIEGAFSAQFQGFKVQKNRLGTEMFVFVEAGEFNAMVLAINGGEGSGVKEPERSTGLYDTPEQAPDFMPTLISLMRAEDTGIPYRADIIYKAPAADAAARMGLIEKVTGWTRTIETAGLPQKYMSAGIESLPSNEGQGVYLHFRRYEPVIITAASTVDSKGLETEGGANEQE